MALSVRRRCSKLRLFQASLSGTTFVMGRTSREAAPLVVAQRGRLYPEAMCRPIPCGLRFGCFGPVLPSTYRAPIEQLATVNRLARWLPTHAGASLCRTFGCRSGAVGRRAELHTAVSGQHSATVAARLPPGHASATGGLRHRLILLRHGSARTPGAPSPRRSSPLTHRCTRCGRARRRRPDRLLRRLDTLLSGDRRAPRGLDCEQRHDLGARADGAQRHRGARHRRAPDRLWR